MDELVGFFVAFGAYGVGAELVDGLWHEAEVAHDGYAGCEDALDGGEYFFATFELECVGVGDFHHLDGVVDGFDVAGLVGAEGHVDDDECSLYGFDY